MPLSEEELRLLEQMERALVAEDPKLASTLRGSRLRRKARRQLILGVLVFVLGVGMLMAGAILAVIPLGILGFVVMLGSAYLTLVTWRGQKNGFQAGARNQAGEASLRVVPGGKSRRPAKSTPKHGTLMERFEERWRRRRDQNGGF